MITIRLNYPYNQDLHSLDMPLPKTFEMKDVCVLLFDGLDEYYSYLNQICDLVDEIEFNRLIKYSRLKAEKLRFCKQYLELLAGAVLC